MTKREKDFLIWCQIQKLLPIYSFDIIRKNANESGSGWLSSSVLMASYQLPDIAKMFQKLEKSDIVTAKGSAFYKRSYCMRLPIFDFVTVEVHHPKIDNIETLPDGSSWVNGWTLGPTEYHISLNDNGRSLLRHAYNIVEKKQLMSEIESEEDSQTGFML